VIQSDPTVIQNFATEIAAGRMTGNDTTRAVVEVVDAKTISDMGTQHSAATSTAQADAIKNSMDQIKEAVSAEIYRAIDDGDEVREKDLTKQLRQVDATRRLMGT
ncbi:MAG: hypothetical protein ABIA47_03365, partial [bacterium]